jgi:predicted AAA+ superfamily ATPase
MGKKRKLLKRAERLLDRLESAFQPSFKEPDWSAKAFRWHPERGLVAIYRIQSVLPEQLLCIERQKGEVLGNTRRFVEGRPANNGLLWGSRGTGKSTLVKAVFNAFQGQGLRLVEVDKNDLMQLSDIVELIQDRRERFLLYCDDLSFDAHEPGYKALKAALDGSIAALPDNLLLYATSNRRHLLPEFQQENQQARMIDGELHQSESVEEKISLSERFGLWVAFHPFDQQQYLAIVNHWLARFGLPESEIGNARPAALRWALRRGSRSGRVAWQFARDWAGREQEERQ